MEELLTYIYNVGYHSGHHDTVEGTYIDIFPQDMKTFHSDIIEELTRKDTTLDRLLGEME